MSETAVLTPPAARPVRGEGAGLGRVAGEMSVSVAGLREGDVVLLQYADAAGRPQAHLQLVRTTNGGFDASGTPSVRFRFVRIAAGG